MHLFAIRGKRKRAIFFALGTRLFCNCKKIIMALREGGVTGLLELFLYLTPNVAMAAQSLFYFYFVVIY